MKISINPKISISCGLVILFSCAPVKNQNAVTKSLDNLAATGSSYTKNFCGANYASVDTMPTRTRKYAARVKSYDPKAQLAALNALHHVPEAISKPFFDQGGTIELQPNSIETCKSTKLTTKERSYIKEASAYVDSCWQQANSRTKPVIILSAEEDKIRHNLLRVMVYFYNEYLVDRLQKATVRNKDLAAVQTAIKSYNAQKKKLMETFLEDAASFNLNASKKLWDLRTDNEERFANIVLAEAIDSYYCSVTTLSKFKKSFSQTHSAFTEQPKGQSFAKLLGEPFFKK
jgi:hypothetical protein